MGQNWGNFFWKWASSDLFTLGHTSTNFITRCTCALRVGTTSTGTWPWASRWRWQGLLKCYQINPLQCFDITQQSRCTQPFSANKFCTVVPNIFSIIIAAFIPYIQNWVSLPMHHAECTRWQCGSQVTPELLVLSMELAPCHLSGTNRSYRWLVQFFGKFLDSLPKSGNIFSCKPL